MLTRRNRGLGQQSSIRGSRSTGTSSTFGRSRPLRVKWPQLPAEFNSPTTARREIDGMKRLAASARGGRSPTMAHAVVCRKRWRPPMEHIGIDVHKVESQICILTESGEIIERRIRTQRERFAAVLGVRARTKMSLQGGSS